MRIIPKVILSVFIFYVNIILSGCKKEDAVTNPLSESVLKLVLVNDGTFNKVEMSHTIAVTLSTYSIGKSEVTYEQWSEVRTWSLTHGYSDLPVGRNGYLGTENHPVTELNWYDAMKWCNACSEKEGLTPAYYTDQSQTSVYRTGTLDLIANAVKWNTGGYRLPTEAEWEFAARGGTLSKGYVYSGSDTADIVAWDYGNSGNNTHPVMTKQPNELGIYDMSGNVKEWCWDRMAITYGRPPETDPTGPTSGMTRIMRSGAFNRAETICTVTERYDDTPSLKDNNLGFRCVKK